MRLSLGKYDGEDHFIIDSTLWRAALRGRDAGLKAGGPRKGAGRYGILAAS
jgi:hypothetical protein